MINRIGMKLPASLPRFASNVLGGDYLSAAPQKDAARRLFEASAEFDNDDEGSGRRTETVFALVPDLQNSYNPQAVAVVMPADDGSVSLTNQLGWIPNSRCATVQPRLISLMRATGEYAGVPGSATYWQERVDEDDWDNRIWMVDKAYFKIQLCSWQQLHYTVQDVMRDAEPDVEQPWVVNRAPRSKLSTRMYETNGESDLLAVEFEISDGSLISTYDRELLSDITAGGRDFFDTLHERVATQGSIRGWAQVQKGCVAIWHEGEPPEVDPSGKWW
jgi:hypothetical protein